MALVRARTDTAATAFLALLLPFAALAAGGSGDSGGPPALPSSSSFAEAIFTKGLRERVRWNVQQLDLPLSYSREVLFMGFMGRKEGILGLRTEGGYAEAVNCRVKFKSTNRIEIKCSSRRSSEKV